MAVSTQQGTFPGNYLSASRNFYRFIEYRRDPCAKRHYRLHLVRRLLLQTPKSICLLTGVRSSSESSTRLMRRRRSVFAISMTSGTRRRPFPSMVLSPIIFRPFRTGFTAQALASWRVRTYIFSSSLLNEFTASYTNSYLTLTDVPGMGVNLQRPPILDAPCALDATGYQECGVGSLFPGNNNAGSDGIPKMPGIDIAGNNAEYGGNGFAVDPSYMPWEHSNPTYSFMDNVTKTWRKHIFEFGAQWIIFQRNQTNGPIGASTGETQA